LFCISISGLALILLFSWHNNEGAQSQEGGYSPLTVHFFLGSGQAGLAFRGLAGVQGGYLFVNKEVRAIIGAAGTWTDVHYFRKALFHRAYGD